MSSSRFHFIFIFYTLVVTGKDNAGVALTFLSFPLFQVSTRSILNIISNLRGVRLLM